MYILCTSFKERSAFTVNVKRTSYIQQSTSGSHFLLCLLPVQPFLVDTQRRLGLNVQIHRSRRTSTLSTRGSSGSRATSTTGKSTARESTRMSAAGSTTTGVGVGDSALLVERSSRADGLAQAGIDAEAQPAEQTVLDGVAEEDVLHERVTCLGLLAEDAVLLVGRQLLGVDRVDARGLDLGDEVLVEEGLADVADVGGVDEGAVVEGRGVGVDQDVDVGGPARVVAREERFERCRAVGVGLLHAAEEGGVDVGRVTVAVAAGHDARVDAGRVAVPDLHVHVGDGLAGVDVEDLDVQGEIDAGLGLGHVLADVLSGHVLYWLGCV